MHKRLFFTWMSFALHFTMQKDKLPLLLPALCQDLGLAARERKLLLV